MSEDPVSEIATTNHNRAIGEPLSSQPPSMSSLSSLIHKLDQSISRLGDDPSPPPPSSNKSSSHIGSNDDQEKEQSLIRTYAPKHLEGPFQELYSILYPCLRPRQSPNEDVTTASAIVMGPRGSGKSLLVERCLAACQQQSTSSMMRLNSTKTATKTTATTLFRKVVVHGIVVRGDDVPSVVYEIVRQLSDIALHENDRYSSNRHGSTKSRNDLSALKNSSEVTAATNCENNENDGDPVAKRQKRQSKLQSQDDYLLRLRKSTFTSNLALLESTLKMAEVDRIPIVLILDELDAFILQNNGSGNNNSSGSGGGSGNQQHRQLLLYHLLDRVATPGSNVTLIGITSNFTALTQMEKRIRSRAEGTSKIIYCRPPTDWAQLCDVLIHDKLANGPSQIRQQISQWLTINHDKTINATTADKDDEDEASTTGAANVQTVVTALQREFRMGRDVRWFCRVLSTALSLYRFDCELEQPPSLPSIGGPEDPEKEEAENGTTNRQSPPFFTPQYLLEALTMLGCLSVSEESTVSATQQSNICLVFDYGHVAVDSRLQASLLDLSTPQVALLLSARRILARQAHLEQPMMNMITHDNNASSSSNNAATSTVAPLTLQRMMQEYKSFRRTAVKEDVFLDAAQHLIERGVLMPSLDHSGSGPLQYHLSEVWRTLDPYSFQRLPLHLPLSMERELDYALQRNLLKCSTALKEWGRKSN